MKSFISLIIASSFLITVPLLGSEHPKFETASVKRTETCTFHNSIDPGMVVFYGDPLKVVLMEAFDVKMDQIVGPSWLNSSCFTINATIPKGVIKDQIPAMLRALLVERFKLVAHLEDRLRPGYALLLDKNGPKIRESSPTSPFTRSQGGQVTFGVGPVSRIKGSMTTATLCRFVSNRLGVPVQDFTGLRGKYDIDVSWVPDRSLEKMGPFARDYAAAHPDSANGRDLPTVGNDDIFSAFRQSLGLLLAPRKERVKVIVIDHIDHIPTEN